jgi:hypothetical protein
MKEIFEDYYKADKAVPTLENIPTEKPKTDNSDDDMLS